MRTPVVLLRMKSSYHFDYLILIQLKSGSQSGDLIRQGATNQVTESVT